MSRRVERRAFLQAALSSLVVLPFAQLGCGGSGTEPQGEVSAASKRDVILSRSFPGDGGLESARFIGRRWLDEQAAGAPAATVDALLAPTVDLIESSANDTAAVDALRDRVHADFVSGAVANVDGWTFAETEIHLCARCADDVSEPMAP